MDVKIKYKEFCKNMAGILGKAGYKKSRDNFILSKDGNFAVINLQKSKKSDGDQILFTINIGIVSSQIWSFLNGTLPELNEITIEQCHWRSRLGTLLNLNDKWWTIDKETTLDSITREFSTYFEKHIFTVIDKNISDGELRDQWLVGLSPGLTDIERMINLSIFLKEIGPKEEYERILEKLNGLSKSNDPFSVMISCHLKMLKE